VIRPATSPATRFHFRKARFPAGPGPAEAPGRPEPRKAPVGGPGSGMGRAYDPDTGRSGTHDHNPQHEDVRRGAGRGTPEGPTNGLTTPRTSDLRIDGSTVEAICFLPTRAPREARQHCGRPAID